MYRIVTSEYFRGVDPHNVRHHWLWAEVLEAHEALDALEKK